MALTRLSTDVVGSTPTIVTTPIRAPSRAALMTVIWE